MKLLKWIGITTGIIFGLGIFIITIIFPHFVSTFPQRATALAPELIPAGRDTTVVFVNVCVIPMDSERILEEQTVIVKDGRIAEIGPKSRVEIPADALKVDGENRFLIPGLSDMHVHLYESENDLLMYLANGVTTIRDLGGPPVRLQWRNEIKQGLRPGPNLWVWSPYIRELDLFDRFNIAFSGIDDIVSVNNADEAEKLVAKYKTQGYDGINVHHPINSLGIYRTLMTATLKHGLRFDGHVPDQLTYCTDKARCWKDFLNLKLDAVAHVDELIKIVDWSDTSILKAAQDVADAGMWVTTTYMYTKLIPAQFYNLEAELATLKELKYVNPGILNRGMKLFNVTMGWTSGKNRWEKNSEDPDVKKKKFFIGRSKRKTAVEMMIMALHTSEVPLLSGTDANNSIVVPGFSLHDELEALVNIGLSPYEALKTSTYNPAVYLNDLEEFGTIEKGKQADLVLLEANPLDDISNTRSIGGVMVRGRWYTRADIDIMLNNIALANAEM